MDLILLGSLLGGCICSSYLLYLSQQGSRRLREMISQREAEIETLKKTLSESSNKNPSLELTEFLRDQSRYGYSFVRVDPESIFLRSPRGE